MPCGNCGSSNCGNSPTGWWCNDCGAADPGYDCSVCGRVWVNEWHLRLLERILCRVAVSDMPGHAHLRRDEPPKALSAKK